MSTSRKQRKRKYDSPPTTIAEQLKIISGRGLKIEDSKEAREFLARVSYYRFSGYALYFEIFENRKRTHVFKPNSTFREVISIYDFDADLRKLIFSTVEYIEIAFRTQLCLHTSCTTKNSHWQLDETLFDSNFDYPKFKKNCKKEIKRSKKTEGFIKSYYENYYTPKFPASWMMIEVVSFGAWSRMYNSLNDQSVRKQIAEYFGINPRLLETWIHTIVIMRNFCAHHSRIWNRTFSINPKLTNLMKQHYKGRPHSRKRIALVLDIISELLKPLGRYDWFIDQLNQLFIQYPDIPYESMGLKANHFTKEKGVRV